MSSRYRTLNRGRYFLIIVTSSWRASTSLAVTIHSTRAASLTMATVRGCRPSPK